MANRKNLTIALLLAALPVLLPSCYKLLETDFPDYEPSLVLNGLLQPGRELRVHVSVSANLGDSAALPLDNAQVRINGNLLDAAGDGWYVSADSAQAGKTYVCMVEAQGFPVLERSATVPCASEIVSFSVQQGLAVSAAGETSRRFSLAFRNDTTQLCYYHFVLHDYTEYYRPPAGPVSVMSATEVEIDPNSHDVFRNEPEPLSVFSNAGMESDVFVLQWNTPTQMQAASDTAFVEYSMQMELQSVSAEYYHHLKQAAVGHYDRNGIFAAYASVHYVVEQGN